MRMVLRYQKPVSLIVLASLFWLCMPQIPAQGAMLTTEDVINQESKADFDRARIKEFLSRNDVIAQLKSYGISADEAQVRVDSLTDQEISLIAGKLNQLPAGGTLSIGWWIIIGIVILSIFLAIIFGEPPRKADPVKAGLGILELFF